MRTHPGKAADEKISYLEEVLKPVKTDLEWLRQQVMRNEETRKTERKQKQVKEWCPGCPRHGSARKQTISGITCDSCD